MNVYEIYYKSISGWWLTMDNLWFIHGLYMVSIWIIYGYNRTEHNISISGNILYNLISISISNIIVG